MQALFVVEGNRVRCWHCVEPLRLKIVQMSCVVHVDERTPYAASTVSVKQKGISVSCVVEGNVRWTQIDWVGTNESTLVDLTNIYAMGWVQHGVGSLRKEEGRERTQHPYWSCRLSFLEGLNSQTVQSHNSAVKSMRFWGKPSGPWTGTGEGWCRLPPWDSWHSTPCEDH